MTVGGDKMPNFCSNNTKQEYISGIKQMGLDSDSLRVYGINIKDSKLSWSENVRYRANVYQWGFANAMQIPGDMIDFGVFHGLFPYLAHSQTNVSNYGKKHFLFDTWGEQWQLHDDPDLNNANYDSYRYSNDIYNTVKNRFSGFESVHCIRGLLPNSFENVNASIHQISFVCIDVNAGSSLEVDLLKTIWDRLSPGAMVYLDDYGFETYSSMNDSINKFCSVVHRSLFELPTGSAFILK